MTTVIVEDDEPDLSSTTLVDLPWHVRDRLSGADTDQLIESFKDATTIPELVARYGISGAECQDAA